VQRKIDKKGLEGLDKKEVVFENGAGKRGENQEQLEQLLKNNEKLRAFFIRTLKNQEQERIRLSRELHDEVGQALTVIKLNLQILCKEERLLTPSALDMLKDSIALLDQTLENVRREAFSLRPPVLDDVGLAAAIEDMAQGFSRRTKIRVDCQLNLSQRLPPEYETALFRCAQEALTNVARHARARQVEILLEKAQGRIRMSIKDDGIGFEPHSLKTSANHIGLMNMQERVKLLGGSFKINSKAGLGTELDFWVPWPEGAIKRSDDYEGNYCR